MRGDARKRLAELGRDGLTDAEREECRARYAAAPGARPDRWAELRALADAATPGPWVWAGNVDTGEPRLDSRAPGMGASVLAIGTADRPKTGRAADDLRSYARECGLEPEEEIERWAEDQYGEPIKEPRLWFYTDHLAVDAREHVVFEVAPNATDRADPKVYRADIKDIRHPDARFIAAARQAVPELLAEVDRLTAALAEADAKVAQWKQVADVKHRACVERKARDQRRYDSLAERERNNWAKAAHEWAPKLDEAERQVRELREGIEAAINPILCSRSDVCAQKGLCRASANSEDMLRALRSLAALLTGETSVLHEPIDWSTVYDDEDL